MTDVETTPPDGQRWPQPDGSPISCRDKLVVLEENRIELAQTMQEVFEDAVLMGVDERAMRSILDDMVAGLRSPRRRTTE